MAANDSLQRSVLPIPDRKPVSLTTYDAKDPDTEFPPITQLRPPDGAPNVFVILVDDVGFGASSAFGGPCQTPNAEKLATTGLKYNRFHTTALCSPTRAAMLSGRNHHAVGMGGITEIATSAPGYNSLRPNTCAPLAEILNSTATRRRSLANVTRCPSSKQLRSVRTIVGPRVPASSTSMDSSAARTTSITRRFMRG